MKIIKDNYSVKEKKLAEQIECEKCSSVFEYDIDDTYVGAYGVRFVKCPLCGHDNITNDFEALTVDTVRFPTHYYSFKDGVDIPNEKVDEYVKDCIEHIREHDTNYCMINTGNTMVLVTKMIGNEEFFVYVGKCGYETSIPFEDIDYEENLRWN